ncbi:ribonuclease H-like domain-containing protein [Salisediminibacterium selenitireducens]|nr:ribonuclease H-like domain-containing protein [Salisediminibacterium selenitireducens]
MKARLKRMATHLQTEPSAERSGVKPAESREVEGTDSPLSKGFADMGFFPFSFEGEYSYRRKTVYPFSVHDQNVYNELSQLTDFWKHDKSAHPLSTAGRIPEELLFFDTETTGLSHGAGNRIFLICYARVNQEGIEVTQHLLMDPGHETAFLAGFLDEISDKDYIVSYNGKSFDWPQVKSRHAFLQKMLPVLPVTGHIDLLHAARRFWKDELPSCRLSVVEEEKLGIERIDDVPGRMAPVLYQEYLFDQNPALLEGIITHNDQDVRSLITLFTMISKRFLYKDQNLTPDEHFAAGKWSSEWKMNRLALQHLQRAVDSGSNTAARAALMLSGMYKKQGNFEESVELLKYTIEHGDEYVSKAVVELSKIFEHQMKQPCEALRCLDRLGKDTFMQDASLVKRRERLLLKCESH